MKKGLIALLILCSLFLQGCIVYGTGESYGYVTTVEQGILYHKAWFRAELESSQTDCYIADPMIVGNLKDFAKHKQRAKITYRRHLITLAHDCLDDEIIGIEAIGG